jgi:succinate dehydrogenase / fumarate reductase cytochrome b subunit
MSAPAVVNRTVRLYTASIGKKAVMAITGLVLFGYVLGHMLGNLQIFLGPERLNNYAEFLHSMPNALWAVRLFLIAMVALHIVASLQLWLQKRRARPVGYLKKDDVPSAYAARTMMWSGPIIAAFVVFHILHLTAGTVGLPFEHLRAYENVVLGFRVWWVSAAYIFAIVLLCMHLYHGLWSMFHSVGWDDERYRPTLQGLAAVFAIFVAAGYIAVPVAVMTGIVGRGV